MSLCLEKGLNPTASGSRPHALPQCVCVLAFVDHRHVFIWGGKYLGRPACASVSVVDRADDSTGCRASWMATSLPHNVCRTLRNTPRIRPQQWQCRCRIRHRRRRNRRLDVESPNGTACTQSFCIRCVLRRGRVHVVGEHHGNVHDTRLHSFRRHLARHLCLLCALLSWLHRG